MKIEEKVILTITGEEFVNIIAAMLDANNQGIRYTSPWKSSQGRADEFWKAFLYKARQIERKVK